ncbi:MAG: hydroxyacid dehydrogenase [Deinococcota bacterium]
MSKLKGLFLSDETALHEVYSEAHQQAIAGLLDIVAEPQTAASIQETPELLNDVDVIMSSWGVPTMDEQFLAHAAKLKAVFHGAGTIRRIVSDTFWQRGIVITSAYQFNAIAVAEYTLATILLSLKRVWHYSQRVKEMRSFPAKKPLPGTYGSKVGIVSLGSIGRKVVQHLQHHQVNVLVYDPFLSEEDARQLAVTKVSLEHLFATSDVVSLHTPALEETHNMITGKHVASMKEGATLINTARGWVVDEPALIHVLQQRSDLYAVLDVTDPEPPEEASPLYDLPNVILTPHIAGNIAKERERHGQAMLEELQRYLAGESLQHGITQEQAQIMA